MHLRPIGKSRALLATPEIIRGLMRQASSIRNPLLRRHCRVLCRMFKHQNHWTSTLRDPCLRLFTKVERDTPLLTGVGPGKLQTVPVLIRFAGFEAEWVRSPETWLAPADTKPVELIYSLARHLFALYGIPRFFDAAWLMGGPIDQVERVWYCHIAKGGNIRTAPRSIPSLTKRAAHRLMQLQSPPGSVSIKKEIRWAQIVTLNENLDYAAHIAWRSRAAVDFSNDAIWLPLFRMALDRNRPWEELHLVIDYLAGQTEIVPLTNFRLAGRTWTELVQTAVHWFERLTNVAHMDYEMNDESPRDPWCPEDRSWLIADQQTCWDGMEGTGPFTIRMANWEWEIVELCSHSELVADGHDMRHCVAGYGRSCRRGRDAIFSLRSKQSDDPKMDRDVTIQVDRETRRVVQARGYRNSRPYFNCVRVMRIWAQRNDLDPGVLF